MQTLRPKTTVPAVRSRKSSRDSSAARITALTAYDFTMARLIDEAGIDIILVGDSLGMVIQGESTTLPVTLDHMIYHTRCVSRGAQHALVVADLPFLSYQVSLEKAIESAGLLLKESSASAVKLEGGVAIADTIKRLTELDIPVMGHIGMTPQSVCRIGGFRQQGRVHRPSDTFAPGTWEQIIEDAQAVEAAGAFCVVLEGVTTELAAVITEKLSIPTVGIAAGEVCDGEILVSYDLLGFTRDSCPPFVKNKSDLGSEVINSVRAFVERIQKPPHKKAV